MKFTNVDQVYNFLEAIDDCERDVYLISNYGDKYNLKSKLTQFVAIGVLLGEHGDELELFCTSKDDEIRMLNFFRENLTI